MRTASILDLGCLDHYVGVWLARKLKAQGVAVRIDGIDLNPRAVEVAQRRLKEEGIDGAVICGDVLSAAEHFPEESYDAVVAFELLEHLPVPAQLLEVCERMARPEGRVYISTPDGTFGSGNNPFHLRAWRAQDLADLLRRRGRLHDMTVGEDGVTVASYSPSPRLGDIAIYTGPSWQTWSPVDIEAKGLGGSETAAVRLAQHLSEIGYIVTVYGEVEQCCFRDVVFKHHATFDPTERRAAVIISRMPELLDRPINAGTTMLWLHDTDCGERLTPARGEAVDHVLVLSRWHEKHVAGLYPFLDGKLRRIRDGIEHAYFERELEDDTRAQRCVYTSSPDRGLDVLLELWPRVREQAPEAVLAYCYSDVYEAVAKQEPTVAEHHALIQKLAKQDGVQALGSLPQHEVARLMRTSRVWAHPSYTTPHGGAPFHETYCIGTVEAQAGGCLVVASNWGALPETVRTGRLVDGPPLSDRWKDAFVTHIVEGLTDDSVARWAQQRGPEEVAELGWAPVAEEVAALMLDGVAGPVTVSRETAGVGFPE